LYEVVLKTGEYFHVDVEQLGIDVVLSMTGSNGQILVERDRPNESKGEESLSYISKTNGKYLLNIRSLKTDVTAGRYKIKSYLSRVPTEKYIKRLEAEILFHEGLKFYRTTTAESIKQACEKYEGASKLWREAGDVYAEALTQTNLGYCRQSLREMEKAIIAHERALFLYQKLEIKQDEALSFGRLCVLFAYLQKMDVSIEHYRKAKSIHSELKNLEDEKQLNTEFGKIALAYYMYGLELQNKTEIESSRQALKMFSLALRMFGALENKTNEAITLTALGKISTFLSDRPKALHYYNDALPLWKTIGDKSNEAIVRNSIGILLLSSEPQKALGYFDEASLLWKLVNDFDNEATALSNVGATLKSLGNKQKAIDFYTQASVLFKKVGNKRGEGTAFSSIGSIYLDLRDREKALDYYVRALPLLREGGNKSTEAATLNNIGLIYKAVGDKQKALKNYNEALPLWEGLQDKFGEATTFSNIASVYVDLGYWQKALDNYTEALPLWRAAKNKAGEARTLNSLGLMHKLSGNKEQALTFYIQALPLLEEVGDISGHARILSNIGILYFDLGDKQKALDYHNEALPLLTEIGDKSGRAGTLTGIGIIYAGMGDKQKAIEFYLQALPLLREVGDTIGEASTLNNIMFALYEQKRTRLGVFYGKLAANIYQLQRFNNQNLDNELQKTFLTSVESTYRNLTVLLIQQGRLAEAQQTLNAFKDQQYFDFNSEKIRTPMPLSQTVREADLTLRYENVCKEIRNLGIQIERLERDVGNRKPTTDESMKIVELETELETKTQQFLEVAKQVEIEFGKSPDVVKDKSPDVADTREMQKVLLKMEHKTVAVYTLVQKNEFHTLIITPYEIISVPSSIDANSLNNKARQLWALLQSDEYDPAPLSRELYDLIFKPIKDKLPRDTKTILWSLDGNLRYLPVGALYDGKKYLAERYNNVVFTRADTERWTRPVSPSWTGVGFGSSQGGNVEYLQKIYPFDSLPNTVEELNAIFKINDASGGIFDGDIFTDKKFTRESMIAALKQHRPLVHISSHFYFSPGDAERSFLYMGDGSVFPLSEMKEKMSLFQGVELLTLSACETAAQWANSDGREVDGFAELAQRQGAAAVMATLWRVRDDSSYWLLRDFYQRKRNPTKETKAEALRRAQLAMIDGKEKIPARTNNNAIKGSKNSTTIKILPEGTEYPSKNEDGVVFVEAKYAKPYRRDASKPYAHPYFWAPFILFGNWH